jgi:two-component system response regulator FlrC
MRQGSVLVVEDDKPLKAALVATLGAAGLAVIEASDGQEALGKLAGCRVDLVISDVQMQPMDGIELLRAVGNRYPQLPVLLMTAYGSIDKAVEAMKQGAADYLVKPFEAAELRARVARFLSDDQPPTQDFIAIDPISRELFNTAERVATKTVTVLLEGESGSGKEVVAQHIHNCSDRADQPLVAINCAAIPENMLEALLFGHEKGAFTGATGRRDGKFVQADGGTLLLDEVSEMDLALQAKLLRVLQEREVEALGAKTPRSVDVRVIATTNRDLAAEVAAGRFREDLFYRLNVFPLHVPALRERPLDVVPLAEHFLVCHQPVDPPMFSLAAEQCLVRHSWPGNVRELENAVERALVLLNGPSIEPQHLRLELAEIAATDSGALDGELKAQEARLIIEALEVGGGRAAAAQRLGISPRTLRYKLARMRAAGVALPF